MVDLFYSVKKLTDYDKSLIDDMISKNDLVNLGKYFKCVNEKDIIVFGQLEHDLDLSFMFFNNNFKYYEPTRESIGKFLHREDRVLIDGHSNIVTPDFIWELVEKNKEKNGYESETIIDVDWFVINEALIDEEISYHGKDWILKYKPKFYEFYNDGLRFSSDDSVTLRNEYR